MENLNHQLSQLRSQPQIVLVFIFWSVFWKGAALWKASNKRQLIWFIILLVFNTLGLLEIAYIFYLNKWDIDNGKLLSFLKKRFGKAKKS